eukprot:1160800-Pelagomonas_calceolata.AAC.6
MAASSRNSRTFGKRRRKNHIGSENTPYINFGKGGTLAQRTETLPHQRVRGKLVWGWWVSGMVIMVTIRGELQPDRFADWLVAGLRQPKRSNKLRHKKKSSVFC